jgi:hypothetical protein
MGPVKLAATATCTSSARLLPAINAKAAKIRDLFMFVSSQA